MALAPMKIAAEEGVLKVDFDTYAYALGRADGHVYLVSLAGRMTEIRSIQLFRALV
jgi:hypothetical protein